MSAPTHDAPPPVANARGRPETPPLVLLTGNPNCGKTTLFNALTGLRGRVGNYAGVTVERKEGRLKEADGPGPIAVLDLPGTYSLSPQSLDEQVSRDALFGRLPDVARASAVVVVADASNLERNLYYATQVLELGYPSVVALNMMDVARANGHEVDVAALAKALGVPVIPTVASSRQGVRELRATIAELVRSEPATARSPARFARLGPAFEHEADALAILLARETDRRPEALLPEAMLLLSDESNLANNAAFHGPGVEDVVTAARRRLEAAGVEWRSAAIEARYDAAAAIHGATVNETSAPEETFSDKLDRVLTHKVAGLILFGLVMAVMFQGIFSFAQVPMDLLEGGVGWAGAQVGRVLPAGDLRSLLVDGVIAGVGAVVVFLPQICLLFLFIGLLEDTGYMARAAFLMDRVMSKVGLHGKSFIPLLGSFACAIPGILATRTIENRRDRLVTILVAPLMSCSARLPVYTLLIAACIPDRRVLGFLRLPGLTLFSMYLLGIVLALVMAWVFKRTLLKGRTPLLIMELPPYRRPLLSVMLRHTWDRAWQFLKNAGTVILGMNVLLWFLASYPRPAQPETDAPAQAAPDAVTAATDAGPARDRIAQSYAGRLGRLIEPVIAPLGYDWKIGVGIVSSFAAREVFVSTMSVVYSVGDEDEEEAPVTLAETFREQKRADGAPVYTLATGLSLMVFYVVALQCASTVAVVYRETNGWKWPLLQWLYMAGLAWLLAFVTYQGGRVLGLD